VDHRAPSITGDHLVELPAIFDNSDEIANQNKNKLSKIQEQNYSLPSRHSIMCLQGRAHALQSDLTFKVLLLVSAEPKLQHYNSSLQSNHGVLQKKNGFILQNYLASTSINLKPKWPQRILSDKPAMLKEQPPLCIILGVLISSAQDFTLKKGHCCSNIMISRTKSLSHQKNTNITPCQRPKEAAWTRPRRILRILKKTAWTLCPLLREIHKTYSSAR
jgi:hypothetical protein